MHKKNNKIFIIIVFSVFMLIPTNISADSGWDSSYDSGSSWDYGSSWDSGSSWSSSNSSWDYDYGSSYSSSGSDYSNSSSSAFSILIFFLLFYIIIGIYNLRIPRKKIINNSFSSDYYRDENIQKRLEDEIRKVIPDFTKDKFKPIVFEKYKEIQIAWMNFDYEALKKNLTDELYNMYHSQLEALKIKKQKNIMEGFSQEHFSLIDVNRNKDEISVKVRTTIHCYDYVVDDKNNVVRGNKDKQNTYYYEMTFVRSINSNDSICPNCGAKIENNNSTVCEYCNSKIINRTSHDWVLSKKEMISQS